MKLLAIGSSPKTIKSDKKGKYLTAIMYLAPADIVDGINLCPMAEKAGCKSACLYSAGRGGFTNVQQARIRKTEWFRDNQETFMQQIVKDIQAGIRKASKMGIKLAVRLNGTSDIAWENIPVNGFKNVMEAFPDVQFYDYTKLPGRRVPGNYHLTASYSEANPAYAAKVAKSDFNIAVVFRKDMPDTFLGRRVINGDESDDRFLDAENVVVGLTAKGPAKKDQTGFVIN